MNEITLGPDPDLSRRLARVVNSHYFNSDYEADGILDGDARHDEYWRLKYAIQRPEFRSLDQLSPELRAIYDRAAASLPKGMG